MWCLTEQELATIYSSLEPLVVRWVHLWFSDHRDLEELESVALCALPEIIPVAMEDLHSEKSLPALVKSAIYHRLIDHFRRDNRPIPIDMSGIPAPSQKLLYSVRLDRETARRLDAIKCYVSVSEGHDVEDSDVLRYVINEGIGHVIAFVSETRGETNERR